MTLLTLSVFYVLRRRIVKYKNLGKICFIIKLEGKYMEGILLQIIFKFRLKYVMSLYVWEIRKEHL